MNRFRHEKCHIKLQGLGTLRLRAYGYQGLGFRVETEPPLNYFGVGNSLHFGGQSSFEHSLGTKPLGRGVARFCVGKGALDPKP